MKKYVIDTWVHLRPRIFLLKIQGKGDPGQSKRRKIDLGKLIIEESESCRPSTTGNLEDIGVDIRVIKELVPRLPKGPREPPTRRHSYVSHSEYEKYQEDQKKKKATVSKLERAYSVVVESGKDLQDSYEKIRKREKKRDNFFRKIWKGVKGLWRVLKPCDKLPSSRVESDKEAPTEWSDAGAGGDDVSL